VNRHFHSILILWSDLLEFYQKQGFRSFGDERRYIYTQSSLSQSHINLPLKNLFFVKHEINSFNDVTLGAFLELRPKTYLTINRSMQEFSSLLTIPNLNVFSSSDNNGKLTAFAILGKGADMESVVHEWGGHSPNDVLNLLSFILADSKLEAAMLLAPKSLAGEFHMDLNKFSSGMEEHAMALAWTNPNLPKKELQQLESLFIWGLDSI